MVMLKEDLKYITTKYLRETKQLPIRNANCCLSYGLDTLYDIILCYEQYGSFSKVYMRNAGIKVNTELDKFCKNIILKLDVEKLRNNKKVGEVYTVIKELTEQEQEMLLSLANRIVNNDFIIKDEFFLLTNQFPWDYDFAIDFYKKNGHFPIFWLFEQYLKNDKSRNTQILTEVFPIFQDKELYSFEEIAKKYGLSLERIRQLSHKILHKVVEFYYNHWLHKRNHCTYILDFLKTLNIKNKDTFELQAYLTQKEQCNLTIDFVLQILSSVFRDEYTLLGGLGISPHVKVWKNTYLIHRNYSESFDFEKFRKQFANMLLNNEVKFLLDIDMYVAKSQCWKAFDVDKSKIIIGIVKEIIKNEFHLGNDIQI